MTLPDLLFQMKPTGFEEFFADAPVTPAVFKEEQSLYDRYEA
jgi:hypothetical protein